MIDKTTEVKRIETKVSIIDCDLANSDIHNHRDPYGVDGQARAD